MLQVSVLQVSKDAKTNIKARNFHSEGILEDKEGFTLIF
jgi:hypothetical protein